MDIRQTRKNIINFFAWAGLVTCASIVRILPRRFLYGFAEGIGRLGYICAVKQRRIAFQSLEIAFGKEKTLKERELIARRCFINMAKSVVEVMFYLDWPGALNFRVNLQGKEFLEAALAKGRGVILVSAHFGNFPLMLGRLKHEGYASGGIMRPMRNALVEDFFRKKRARIGVKTIYSQPRRACVETTIRSLRDNELIFIPLDQNFGTAGVFVDFFGLQAATATGPVVLARRTKAAVVPTFIVRNPDDTHTIIFEPELAMEETGNEAESIKLNVQKITVIIETYIRRYPAEWGWIHRRWKSRPAA